MSQITIYHNPQCGTSRNTLELIRNSGEEPTVIEYLQTPPDRTTLVRLIKDMGSRCGLFCVSKALRTKSWDWAMHR